MIFDSAVQQENSFLEIRYDPLIVRTDQITLMLKEISQNHARLEQKYGMQFASVRKLNPHIKFSFSVQWFNLGKINNILSGQQKFQ